MVACELARCIYIYIGKCVFTTSFTAGDAADGLFGDGVALLLMMFKMDIKCVKETHKGN